VLGWKQWVGVVVVKADGITPHCADVLRSGQLFLLRTSAWCEKPGDRIYGASLPTVSEEMLTLSLRQKEFTMRPLAPERVSVSTNKTHTLVQSLSVQHVAMPSMMSSTAQGLNLNVTGAPHMLCLIGTTTPGNARRLPTHGRGDLSHTWLKDSVGKLAVVMMQTFWNILPMFGPNSQSQEDQPLAALASGVVNG